MDAAICVRCGAWYPPAPQPPAACPVCEDEREGVLRGGQAWITPADLAATHRNVISDLEPGLTGIVTEPAFAIAQQAHLIATPAGNLLWNCISLIDDATVAALNARGGVAAIAVSHPHFFTGVAAWSAAFGDIPIYLHAADREWVTEPSAAITFWEGETCEPLPGSGLTLVRCGGHFAGSCALHWPEGAAGDGALLTGDTITVVHDRRWVTFMYSYPNIIPLGPSGVRRIVAATQPFRYERLYGGWPGSVVESDAQAAVQRSADRYLAHIAE